MLHFLDEATGCRNGEYSSEVTEGDRVEILALMSCMV